MGKQLSRFEGAEVHTIRVPSGQKWSPENAKALISRMSNGRVILRIVADNLSTKWQIIDVDYQSQRETIQGAVRSIYPNAEVFAKLYQHEPFVRPFFRYVQPFYLVNEFIAPIKYVEQLKTFDPLLPLTNLLGFLRDGERIIYTISVGIPAQDFRDKARSLFQENFFERAGRWLEKLRKNEGYHDPPTNRYDPAWEAVFREKIEHSLLFPTIILIQFDTPNPNRLNHFSSNIEHTFYEFRTATQSLAPYYGLNLWWQVDNQAQADSTNAYSLIRNAPLKKPSSILNPHLRKLLTILNERELAALWHLPTGDYQSPTIEHTAANQVRVPIQLVNNREGIYLGYNEYAGVRTNIYMLERDRLAHQVIVGKTEQGKSTSMHRMIAQDIERGRGVAVVDPEGRLVRAILRSSIPPEREKDVVVWDIGNYEYPPPLNPLAVRDKANRHEAAIRFEDIYARFDPEFVGTRMSSNFGDVLRTLMELPQASVRDIRKILIFANFREPIVEKLEDDAAYEFWEDYEAMSEAAKRDLLQPLSHRFRRFYRGETMDAIINHPQPLDFDDLISQNKIILVSLETTNKTEVSEEQLAALGAILISKFEVAASANAAKEPYFLYVDEADLFVTTTLSEMFKRARKRNLHLILATQSLDSLAGKTLNAVVGNVGAILAFNSGEPTAMMLAPYMSPSFNKEKLTKLNAFQAAMFMKFRKQQLPAFTLEIEDMPEGDPQTEQRIRKLSNQLYTPMTREQVLNWIKTRYPRRRGGNSNTGTDDSDDFEDDTSDDWKDDWGY